MPKLSTIKTDDTQLDPGTLNLLNEIFPEKKKNEQFKYPKLTYAFILTLIFLVLSQSFIDDLIVKITPSFEAGSYLVTLVKGTIFLAIAYVLLRTSYFSEVI